MQKGDHGDPHYDTALGWDMEQGVFLGWLKSDGAQVRSGEALFTLESDKSTEEIESLDEGILHIALNGPRAGDKLAVGAVIGYLLKPGETLPTAEAPRSVAAHCGAEIEVNIKQQAPTFASSSVRHSGPAISPRAKRIAGELGIDWTKLKGSGRTGRIREQDVRRAGPVPKKGVPISTMRRTIAERMIASQRATAAVTLTSAADATNLVNLRNQARRAVQAGHDLVPSYTDFLVKLASIALQKHPLLNASWVGDQIVLSPTIDVGIAVHLEDGLLVPVLRDVASLGLRQVAVQTRLLIDRARRRQLRAEEMQHGSFTLTNLGGFGVDAFTPIIHFPQSAILGVGRIQRRPVVVGASQDSNPDPRELIVARDQITLSLTFDHRVVDGAPAAQFLQTLSMIIENPAAWLLS